jgi:uncharacterized protein YggE
MRTLGFAAALVLATACFEPRLAVAEQAQAAAVQGTLLTVNAMGKITGKPDMATLDVGVTTQAPTAAAAMQANARQATALIAALRRAGIAERDIQTSNISVNPQQQFRENQPPLITGYEAVNTVVAKIRSIENTGRVIDAAVAAGGNTIHGVEFSYQDPDAQMDAARRDAIANARRRADLYAQALNMHVARIVAVSEGASYSPPVPLPMARMALAEAATPIQPGQIETTASVTVSYELR